jgi:hypothetical protein
MAVTPQAQSTAPAISLATLREVLADLKAGEPERGMRWDHAAMIVALRRIEPGIRCGWWVESECEAGRFYWVFKPSVSPVEHCMCQDFKVRGGPCKHALAVRLLQACQSHPVVIPFPTRTLPDDEPIPFELTDAAHAALDHEPVA